ncbi:hypothetical protein BDR04DRAFT_1117259 [Suillus decipiens]|nr:hypothetical protein BDR04DRAFT_1117259 [Suillus decipiens]
MDGSPAINYPLLAREVNYHLLSTFVLQLWDMETLELIFQMALLVPTIYSINSQFLTLTAGKLYNQTVLHVPDNRCRDHLGCARIPSIPYCILSKPPYQIIYHAVFSIAVMTTQSALLGLALIKHILARRDGWGRAPLVSLLIRDGTTTFFITCVILFCIGSFCELRDERTVIMFL